MNAPRRAGLAAGATVLLAGALLAGANAIAASPAPAAAAPAASASEAAAQSLDTGPALRHDPFRRPRFGPDGLIVRETADEREGKVRADEAPPWQPALRGVMLAGRDSIANVDGSIVRIGEAIDGWRLVRVADGQAWFAKGGRQTTLTMNNAGNARQ